MRNNFWQFAFRIGYIWLIIGYIFMFFIAYKIFSSVAFFFLFIFIIGLGFYLKTDYDEYNEFMDIVEYEDYDLYIPKIKAFGNVVGYGIANDCSIIIKKDTIYWFNFAMRGRYTKGLWFCLEFNTFERPVEWYGSYFNTIEHWKMTSRGNIQLIGQKQKSLETKLLITIYSNIDEIKPLLPKNLEIN